MRLILAPVVFAILFFGTSCSSPPHAETRPNFLVIVTDDQRYDEMIFMPQTRAKIFEKGCEFKRAYVTTPLCCPSRSSILTGMYASKHGVKKNSIPLSKPTFVQALKQQGNYYTGHIGKFLNSSDGTPREEYDYWIGQKGGAAKYYNPLLNVNGQWLTKNGYSTYLYRDFAMEFFDRAAKQSEPFFLYLAFSAPHYPALEAPRDLGADASLPQCIAHAAEYINTEQRKLGQTLEIDNTKMRIGNQRSCKHKLSLLPLDRAIKDVVEHLEKLGVLDNTVIFFISDNGFLFREHGLLGKNSPFQESVRVPFALRYSKLVSPQLSDRLAANIDIAPTVLRLAGLPIGDEVDGLSLLDAIDGKPWRQELLLEGFGKKINRDSFDAITTGDHVFVRFSRKNRVTKESMFDLVRDPFELVDLANLGVQSELRDDLRNRLDRLVQKVRQQPARK